MTSLQYKTTIVVGALCLGMSLAIVVTAKKNIALQADIQERSQRLNSGVLGPQAQQITGNILQDMAAVAAKNAKMRDLLAKHGYNVPAAPAPESVKKSTPKVQEEK